VERGRHLGRNLIRFDLEAHSVAGLSRHQRSGSQQQVERNGGATPRPA